MIVIAL